MSRHTHEKTKYNKKFLKTFLSLERKIEHLIFEAF